MENKETFFINEVTINKYIRNESLKSNGKYLLYTVPQKCITITSEELNNLGYSRFLKKIKLVKSIYRMFIYNDLLKNNKIFLNNYTEKQLNILEDILNRKYLLEILDRKI